MHSYISMHVSKPAYTQVLLPPPLHRWAENNHLGNKMGKGEEMGGGGDTFYLHNRTEGDSSGW